MACVLTTVTLLAGSTSKFYAADYEYETWSTYVTSPNNMKTAHFATLYNSDDMYRWAVTAHSTQLGYGCVRLYGYNCTIDIQSSGGNILTHEGYRDFEVPSVNGGQRYATFKIAMDYADTSATTTYSGYIKIITN